MKKIFRDLTGKMASFINDMIVGIKAEKEYDELVEEVVRRLAKNNLYVKLEKYKWKVREIEFLGIVIRPKRIKIEEVKMKGVLDWPTLKEVKDI